MLLSSQSEAFPKQEMYEQREENAQCFHIVIAPKQTCLSILCFHMCVKKSGTECPERKYNDGGVKSSPFVSGCIRFSF